VKPAEVTPLRRPDPELQAVRELVRLGRRRTAWRLLAAGMAMVAAGVAVLALTGVPSETGAGGEVGIQLTGVLTAAAGLTALIGAGLVGTALYVLARSRIPGH
jgi:hypothetical protein